MNTFQKYRKLQEGESESEVAQSCPTLCDPMDYSLPGCSIHGILQAISWRMVCHFLLQETFLTQGLNPGLLHCRQTLYCLSYQGRPWWGLPPGSPQEGENTHNFIISISSIAVQYIYSQLFSRFIYYVDFYIFRCSPTVT